MDRITNRCQEEHSRELVTDLYNNIVTLLDDASEWEALAPKDRTIQHSNLGFAMLSRAACGVSQLVDTGDPVQAVLILTQ